MDNKQKMLLEFKEQSSRKSFEEFLLARLDWEMYLREQADLWSEDLESLILELHNSGLLKETAFHERIKNFYDSINV